MANLITLQLLIPQQLQENDPAHKVTDPKSALRAAISVQRSGSASWAPRSAVELRTVRCFRAPERSMTVIGSPEMPFA